MNPVTISLLLILLFHKFKFCASSDIQACESLQYVELGNMGTVECSAFDADFIGVWWYNTSTGSTDELLIYCLESVKGGVGFTSGEYDISPSGSLLIQAVSLEHEGSFKVKYLQSQKVEPVKYEVDVVVIVIPVPPYPIVEGCNQEQNCELVKERQGNLTCTVKGILPLPTIEWSTYYDNESPLISFTNNQVNISKDGDTFDVLLTSEYRVSEEPGKKLVIKCKASLTNMETLYLKATNVTLLFTDGIHVTETTTKTAGRDYILTPDGLFYLICGIVAFAVLIALIVGLYLLYFYCYKKKRRENNKVRKSSTKVESEEQNLIPGEGTMNKKFKANRNTFIQQLRDYYETLYAALQPIPYLKDKLSSVNTIFVEPGIQILNSEHGTQGQDRWKDLNFYQELLKDNTQWKKKRLLEADLGFGKSTLSLQIVYDWCNHKMEDVKLLLFLRLRECKTAKPFHEAIKRRTLPTHTTLTDSDIKDIIEKTKSVLILLDGFEDFQHFWNTTKESDFHKIIKGEMLQGCVVLLTTKTSVLPKESVHLMERFKLTGFNDDARKRYMKQVMKGHDNEAKQRVEQLLKENAIVSDLCQSPLIFIILAHMISANKNVQDLRSVTKCVRFMFSGMHSHRKNKLEDGKNSKRKRSETSSKALNKMAFEMLTKHKGRVCKKKDFIKAIGKALYEQCQQTGILVEKENEHIDIGDKSGKYVKKETEVIFYHELFCEWYAAHHMSDHLNKLDSEAASEWLESLDPSNLQYFYQFACGLNVDSAQTIIEHLISKKDRAKFAIPCIMEQADNIDSFKMAVEKLCQDGIIISGHDNLVLQRSSIHLLSISSKLKLSLDYVELHNCFKSVDVSKGEIIMRSGLSLSKEIPVKDLCISLTDKPLTVKEGEHLLQFSSMCSTLKNLWYRNCVPPFSFNEKSVLSSLKEKDANVKWKWSDKDGDKLCLLNLNSGRWDWEREDGEAPPTKKDFKRMVEESREDLRDTAEKKDTMDKPYDNEDETWV